MSNSSEDLVDSLHKFSKKNVKSSKNTNLAKTWQRQFTGKNFARKLYSLSWKVVGGALIWGAFSKSVDWGNQLIEEHNRKYDKPQLIDVPDSYADEDGKVLDWSKCPEAYQPDENGNYPDEPGNNSAKKVKLKSVRKSGEKAVVAEAHKKIVVKKLASKAKNSSETKTASEKSQTKETKQDKISLVEKVIDVFRGGDSEEKNIMEKLNLNSTQKAQVAAWKKRALKNEVAEDVFNHNLNVLMSSKTTTMLSVIYFENFSDTPYLDSKGVPTIGYGEREVFGVILSKVKVKLNKEQAVAISSFVYNIGNPLFEKSTFLKKLNKKNKSAFAEMTRFNVCAKKWNQGLQVRRGIEYLIATGKLNPDELLDFRASGGYDPENLGLLFDLKKLRKTPGKMNLPTSSSEKLMQFVKRQKRNGRKVKNIMDIKTVQQVSDDKIKLAMRNGSSRGV